MKQIHEGADNEDETNMILRLASAKILRYAYRHLPEGLPKQKTLWTQFDTRMQLHGIHTPTGNEDLPSYIVHCDTRLTSGRAAAAPRLL